MPQLLPEAALRGLTLGGLRKMEAKVRALHASGRFAEEWTSPDGKMTLPAVPRFEDLTTEQLVYRWVKDHAVTGDERLADCPEHVDKADVGTPSYFISHAWKGTFPKLLKSVFAFLSNASEDTRVWIDCLVRRSAK